jgi:hypothetical protein
METIFIIPRESGIPGRPSKIGKKKEKTLKTTTTK